jgi:hypothetical protein
MAFFQAFYANAEVNLDILFLTSLLFFVLILGFTVSIPVATSA